MFVSFNSTLSNSKVRAKDKQEQSCVELNPIHPSTLGSDHEQPLNKNGHATVVKTTFVHLTQDTNFFFLFFFSKNA